MRRRVAAVAHRGDPYRVRENTLESVRSALGRGADAVEVDVRVTRDGVPVLLHDASLERLWGHGRALADVSYGELADLTGGGVPSLRDVLQDSDGRLQLDLPGAAERDVRTMAGVVRDCGAQDRVYWTGAPTTMLYVRAAEPAAEIAMTWRSVAPPLSSLVASVRPRWINYRFGVITSQLVERDHRDGLLVAAWTVDTAWSMRRLIAAGVDAITTNRVGVLSTVVAKAEAHASRGGDGAPAGGA